MRRKGPILWLLALFVVALAAGFALLTPAPDPIPSILKRYRHNWARTSSTLGKNEVRTELRMGDMPSGTEDRLCSDLVAAGWDVIDDHGIRSLSARPGLVFVTQRGGVLVITLDRPPTLTERASYTIQSLFHAED